MKGMCVKTLFHDYVCSAIVINNFDPSDPMLQAIQTTQFDKRLRLERFQCVFIVLVGIYRIMKTFYNDDKSLKDAYILSNWHNLPMLYPQRLNKLQILNEASLIRTKDLGSHWALLHQNNWCFVKHWSSSYQYLSLINKLLPNPILVYILL